MNTSKDLDDCAKQCLDCYQACAAALQHCLTKGGKHVEAAHVQLLQDCVEICRASADFLLRGSPRHEATCAACAEVCRRCAQDCRRFEGDRAMQACADACERCAKACESMAGAAAR